MKANFKNLIELVEFFNSEEVCVKFLKSTLWQNEARCPHCNSNQIMEYKNFKRNRCKSCKKDFSIRQGTIFEDSNISLKKWFMAIYLFSAHKKGISSCQLAKDIGVSQPTAWFILHRLRFASVSLFQDKFSGTCEIDETYIGGKAQNMHISKRIKANGVFEKSVVMGIINRDTKQVKGIKVDDATSYSLVNKINENINTDSIVITDEHKSYKSIPNSYNHKTVNHSKDEYVNESSTNKRGEDRRAFKVHTNTIEGFWSQLKRGINGIYHWASKKHIQKYVNEFSFRYNTKSNSDYERFNLFCASYINCKLSYNDLIKV